MIKRILFERQKMFLLNWESLVPEVPRILGGWWWLLVDLWKILVLLGGPLSAL